MSERCQYLVSGEEYYRITEGNVDKIYDSLGRLIMSSATEYLDIINNPVFGSCIHARHKTTGVTSWYNFEGTLLFI